MLGAIENFHKAIAIDRGPSLPNTYRYLSKAYMQAGFKKQSDFYSLKALELDGDSAQYYSEMASNEFWINRDWTKSFELLEIGYRIDTTNIGILHQFGTYYMKDQQYEKALEYYEDYLNQFNDLGDIPVYEKTAIGYTYLMNGVTGKADSIFEQQIIYAESRLLLGNTNKEIYGILAEICAIRGERDKALQYMPLLNQSDFEVIYGSRENQEHGIIFKYYKNEPAYQQLVNQTDAKYQLQHERVRQWLEAGTPN